MIDKINELVGTPYDISSYHCWHLVKDLVPGAPDFEVVAATYATSLKLCNESTYDNLHEVTSPIDGDILLLGRNIDHLYHAGVYFQGKVVHCDVPAVQVNELSDMRKLYPGMRILRCTT